MVIPANKKRAMRGGDYQGDKQGVGRYGEDRAFHKRYDSKGDNRGGFVRECYGIMVKAGEHGRSFVAGFGVFSWF